MKKAVHCLMVLAVAGLITVLSGCSVPNLVFSPEELYALPELPAKYTELNSQINEILADGAESAAPAPPSARSWVAGRPL